MITRDPTNPGRLHQYLEDVYRSYYETEFEVRDPAISDRRGRLLTRTGGLSQEPMLEMLPGLRSLRQTVEELCSIWGSQSWRRCSQQVS